MKNYPNDQMSGCGITWQFCRYIDKLLNVSFADDFLDLVALGNCGDMMSLHSFETRYLITKGFQKENIKNPFIEYMIDKNMFPLSKTEYKPYQSNAAVTSMGAAFFIVPFVNAVTRSGTLEEKELCFKSMLEYEAFKQIPEIKRNKLTGKTEPLVLQAVRVISNVKNRQTREEEKGMEFLEQMIENDFLLDHKVLLFLLEPGDIEPAIRGLVANKMMSKYQRPCLVLTFNKEKNLYEGSGRGYTKNGLDSFKELLERCPQVEYVQGHDNAHGCGIKADEIESFIAMTDALMEDVSSDPIYRVDYSFNENNVDPQKIIDIGGLNDFWGQDIDRAYVSIRFKITDSNFSVMKSNTLKITLNNGLSIIRFGGTEEDIETFTTTGYVEIEAYCECLINEWNGREYPQLIIKDYEVIDSAKYYF